MLSLFVNILMLKLLLVSFLKSPFSFGITLLVLTFVTSFSLGTHDSFVWNAACYMGQQMKHPPFRSVFTCFSFGIKQPDKSRSTEEIFRISQLSIKLLILSFLEVYLFIFIIMQESYLSDKLHNIYSQMF